MGCTRDRGRYGYHCDLRVIHHTLDTLHILSLSDSVTGILEIEARTRNLDHEMERVIDALSAIANLGFLRAGRHDTKFTASNRLKQLDQILFLSKQRQCTDPRDVVYGILSLVEFPGLTIIPDYRKSTSVVYTETTRVLIEEQGNLNFLCIKNNDTNKRPYEWLKQGHIPSWVPDYSAPRHSLLVGNNAPGPDKGELFSPCGDAKIDIDTILSEEINLLRLQGIIFDTIFCATPMATPLGNWGGLPMVRQWEKAIQGVAYPTGEDTSQAFYLTCETAGGRLEESAIAKYTESYIEWSKDSPTRPGYPNQYTRDFSEAIRDELKCGYSFFVTSKDKVEGQTEIGDAVCIVYRSCVPWVRRYAGSTYEGKTTSIEQAGFHTLVGTAYHGVMDGEIVSSVISEGDSQTILLV